MGSYVSKEPRVIPVAVAGFSVAVWALNEYLRYRQRNVYKLTEDIPNDLITVVDKESFEKSRLYCWDRNIFQSYKSLFELLEENVFLLAGGIPCYWKIAGFLASKFNMQNELTQTFAFVCLLLSHGFICGQPWKIYSNFVLEEKHGFNEQTYRFFVTDQIKGFLLQLAIVPGFSYLLTKIMRKYGSKLVLYGWGFSSVTMMMLMIIYPQFIAPIFDKYERLETGVIREKIGDLAKKMNFPLKDVYVVEGSKRSAHSNAYFYGIFGQKRIVLFDTLFFNRKASFYDDQTVDSGDGNVKGCSLQEIQAILCHEIGHWKHWHIWQRLLISELIMLLYFQGVGMLDSAIYKSFGFENETPVFVGMLLVFQYLTMPLTQLQQLFLVWYSRRCEYQSDSVAVQCNYGRELQSALVKLYKDNNQFPVFDPLYSAFNMSHPTLVERLTAIDEQCSKRN